MNRPDPKRRRNLSAKQLNWLAWRRWWSAVRYKAWKEKPEKMEAARVEATKQAAKKKHDKNDGLRQVLAGWPPVLSCSQLRERIAADIAYKGKPSSLIWRMRRHGMLTFREDGNWVNACSLTSSTDGQPNA